MTADKLNALAVRVEGLGEPSREVDCHVWLIVGDGLGSAEYGPRSPLPMKPSRISNGRWMGSAMEKYPDDISGIARIWRVPLFTASLDAAMSLVPEGFRLFHLGESRYMTRSPAFSAQLEVWTSADDVDGSERRAIGVAATPALALVSACLKARALTQEPPHA